MACKNCGKDDMVLGKIKVVSTNSCCRTVSKILELNKPLTKNKANYFKEAGFTLPDNFFNVGLFYAQKGTLIVSGTYGGTKYMLRCSGDSCQTQIDELVKLFEILELNEQK